MGVSSTKSGRPMTSTRVVPSTRRRQRSSSRTRSETSDQEMSSLMKLSMRYSPLSIRITQELSRRMKWSSSSNSSSVETEHSSLVLCDQDSYNEDQRQLLGIEAR